MNAEQQRLEQNNNREQHWHLWGPYLSERQWGTVREDYSANGDAWNYFPHDHARSAPTAGAKMESAEFLISKNGFALPLPSGTSAIPSSRNASLVSRVRKEPR
jgi:hypothetical protein